MRMKTKIDKTELDAKVLALLTQGPLTHSQICRTLCSGMLPSVRHIGASLGRLRDSGKIASPDDKFEILSPEN